VLLSVEKDPAAHQTLLLRSFFRQFSSIPPAYYEYLKGDRSAEELFRAFPDAAATATARCLHLEMGPRTTKHVYGHIQRALGNAKAWVLVGGPPCQAYSVVDRSRLTKLGRSAFEDKDMHVLYREYLRILARYKPPVFVMENVKGLLSAKFAGTSTFKRIISDLSSPSVAVRGTVNGCKPRTRRGSEYEILSFTNPTTRPDHLRSEDYVIATEKFGVPQKRHRVILLGIRSDLTVPGDVALRPSPAPTVRDVLADLPLVRSQLSREKDNAEAWTGAIKRAVRAFQPRDFDNNVRETMIKHKRQRLRYIKRGCLFRLSR
jgi:DNA (cytosine-5)-methyltransferase 1